MVTTFSIPNPNVPFVDPKTGLISVRDWYTYIRNIDLTNGNVGTTTQVLHGGGAGFGQVALSQDVTGILPGVNGGTGVANAGKTMTFGGNVNFNGAFPLTMNYTVTTNVTLPASGTLLSAVTLVGDVTGITVSSTITTAIGVNVVTNSQLAQMPTRTIKGNNTVTIANAADIAAGQFPATQTNDLAVAGNVGEYVTSTITSGQAIGLSSTVVANVTSKVLTAGDWDVAGQVDYTAGGGAIIQYMQQGVNTVSATLPSQDNYSSIVLGASVVTDPGNPIPLSRISISTTTTAYLVAKSSFTVGTLSAYGTLRARRVR